MKPSKQEIDKIKNDFINEIYSTIPLLEALYDKFSDEIEEITQIIAYNDQNGTKIDCKYNLIKQERYNLRSELQTIKQNIGNLINFTKREDGDVVTQLHKKAGQKAYRDKIDNQCNFIITCMNKLLTDIQIIKTKYGIP